MKFPVPTRAIKVNLWGCPVGVLTLGPDGGARFQYYDGFRRGGVEIAPFEMPLSDRVYSFSDFGLPVGAFFGLPGVFADSLPDQFGNKLVAEWMRRHGIPPGAATALDRLAYVGSRGMGALTYEPEWHPAADAPTALDLRRVAEEARLALNSDLSKLTGDDALREIIRVGTSAGGAQSKAVVAWNRETGEFLAALGNLPDGFEHWIVKFTPREDPDAGEREYAVHRRVVAAGIEMSECRLQELDGVRHFMTRRFDRDRDCRHLVQTHCAMRHLPIGRSPASLCTYEGVFETIAGLGMGYDALAQMFRRMAFNVAAGECDDHAKNFSYLKREDSGWTLAPAYDLTAARADVADAAFSEFANRHALSVNGRFSSIREEDLLAVGERFGIGEAKSMLEQVKDAVFGGEGDL